MKTIHKYLLSPLGCAIPQYAKIIDIQIQHSNMYCWAIVYKDDPLVTNRLRVFATGEELPIGEPLNHLKTIQLGDLVWHIFDLQQPKSI